MTVYAVLSGTTIINKIVAESLEDAQSLTGYPCVEDPNNSSFIGGEYLDGIFIFEIKEDPELPVE
jgi:hypothetical protein